MKTLKFFISSLYKDSGHVTTMTFSVDPKEVDGSTAVYSKVYELCHENDIDPYFVLDIMLDGKLV